MGTTVVYAVIFMIWFETPIVLVNNLNVRLRQYILLYKRFMDDLGLFLIWTGPAAVLCYLCTLATADKGVSLDWSGCKSHQEAVNP